jgi:mannose-1-phosphate guanylyltransferase/mannose-6-phosphate isomerase
MGQLCERLEMNEYQVKRIIVEPGGVVSPEVQASRRALGGGVRREAEVTIDDSVRARYCPANRPFALGAVHRLANRGTEPVVLIDVQTGAILARTIS